MCFTLCTHVCVYVFLCAGALCEAHRVVLCLHSGKTKYPLLFFSFLPSFLCLFQSQLMAQSALLNTCISGNTWEFIYVYVCVCGWGKKECVGITKCVSKQILSITYVCLVSLLYVSPHSSHFFFPLKQNLHTTFTPAHTHTNTHTHTHTHIYSYSDEMWK